MARPGGRRRIPPKDRALSAREAEISLLVSIAQYHRDPAEQDKACARLREMGAG